jgi:hypothetical protein
MGFAFVPSLYKSHCEVREIRRCATQPTLRYGIRTLLAYLRISLHFSLSSKSPRAPSWRE